MLLLASSPGIDCPSQRRSRQTFLLETITSERELLLQALFFCSEMQVRRAQYNTPFCANPTFLPFTDGVAKLRERPFRRRRRHLSHFERTWSLRAAEGEERTPFPPSSVFPRPLSRRGIFGRTNERAPTSLLSPFSITRV